MCESGLPDQRTVWLAADQCRVEDLDAVAGQQTLASDCAGAAGIERGVPVYDCTALRAQLDLPGRRQKVMAEWVHVLGAGPGVFVLRSAFDDPVVIDGVTRQFQAMIEAERATGAGGDHFAKPGANDRVWNALEKLCVRAPDLFAAYYANDALALASEAWLGPSYQMTSQVNCVNPGGEAQAPHRDYHLGFMTARQAEDFPAHVHRLSPMLTLQGAVAHVDMPLISGPTLFLPHSQQYLPGYLVAADPRFQAYFRQHCVQLALGKGDAVFFNPALMHAAGHNRSSDIRRVANLLQVSSAFGRAMETVDRARMARLLFPVMRDLLDARGINLAAARRAVAACAEGYAFPTNLDRDPPLGGLAPESQQALMIRALADAWTPEQFGLAIDEHERRREG